MDTINSAEILTAADEALQLVEQRILQCKEEIGEYSLRDDTIRVLEEISAKVQEIIKQDNTTVRPPMRKTRIQRNKLRAGSTVVLAQKITLGTRVLRRRDRLTPIGITRCLKEKCEYFEFIVNDNKYSESVPLDKMPETISIFVDKEEELLMRRGFPE